MLPNEGVGLARVEFIINKMIGIHPKALLDMKSVDKQTARKIQDKIAGYSDPKTFFIEKLSEGIATIAASFSPKPVIVRLSDFKSNEYANLMEGSILNLKKRIQCWDSGEQADIYQKILESVLNWNARHLKRLEMICGSYQCAINDSIC